MKKDKTRGGGQIHRGRRIVSAIAVLLMGVVVYAYLVYHGYVLLNYPPRAKYPISGVDLSHYQGEVDWAVLAAQDIQFAYIKATEGSSHTDDRFSFNWEQAGKTDLQVGAYHFFSFDSPGETQAEHFINFVGTREGMLPPAIDAEYYADKKDNPPDPEEVRGQLRTMLEKVQEHYGMTPVIYSTQEVWETYLKGYFDEYPLWIRSVFTKPDGRAEWTFWQYTNRARMKGYTGGEIFIDRNVFCGGEEEWRAWRGEPSPPPPTP